jgi:chromosome partitioning protein
MDIAPPATGGTHGGNAMAARIITIAQQKGGAGKTTVAAQLAVAFAAAGKRVALIDIDPQASLATWFNARNGAGDVRHPLSLSEVTGWRLGGELDRLARSHDIVLVDSPPHAETEAKAAVRAAHLVLVPVQPSPMDVWATEPTLDLARGAGVPFVIVLNRVPPKGRVVDMMRTMLADKHLPVASAVLGNRVAFAASMLTGQTVLETAANTPAAAEVRSLAAEITALIAT